MINLKNIFTSKKYNLLFSMSLTLLSILILQMFNLTYMNLELAILPTLTLIGGPVSLLGFAIVELIYLIFSDVGNITANLTITAIIILGSIILWKLWYSITSHHEIPNLNSLYNIKKLMIVFIIYFIIIETLFFEFNNERILSINFENNIIILLVPLVMLFTVFILYLTSKFKIKLYTPKKQLKVPFTKRIYSFSLILGIIIGLANILILNDFNFTILSILCIIIYLLKPYDEEIFKIKNYAELNLFNKINISIFSIIMIEIIILTILPFCLGLITYNNPNGIFFDISEIGDKLFIIFLIPSLIYLHYLEKNVINPVNRLSKFLSSDLDNINDFKELKNNISSINTNNEINSLADSLLEMENKLIKYSEQLVDVTTQKEKIETELKLAHDIQYSMIPRDFKEFSNNYVEIWGLMMPAREVGGDFYDYFKIDEDNVGFVIGDVSGKGITASLIMVKTMTLIQDYAKQYSDLSKVFYEVNNLLCEGNVENHFVTCWFGKLNIKTGDLNFVNAGHNQPLIKQNNCYDYLTTRPGLVLAAMEDVPYKVNKIKLNKNDSIFLYTDGVTEANDNYNGFYGEKRLQNILNKHSDDNLENIVKYVKEDVDGFCNYHEQFDDTTMFILKMQNNSIK